MARFSVNEAKKLFSDLEKVRNLGIIAHIDHGKSTLTDSLLAASGLIKEEIAGQARATDTREDEQERGITIKTTGISLGHDFNGEMHLINLQDTPGHVDFSGEVTSALRVVDGALVVVDAVEGVMVQTETVVSQALAEHVRPVLIINKVDRLITEMRMPPEDAYEQFKKIIRDFNVLIQTYAPEPFKKSWQVDPKKGSVAFGSAVHRFGLTIPALAEIWAKKTGKPVDVLINAFWQKNNFVNGVLKPAYEIYNMTEEGNVEKLKEVVKKLGVKVPEETWLMNPKQMAKAILEKWLPVEKAVLDMVCKFLPSPLKAVKPISEGGHGRIKGAWDGDLESEVGKAMIHCDPNGPLMISLSKMILFRAKRVVAMGRIFSGTLKKGDRVTVYLPGYKPGSKERKFTTNVQSVAMLMGKDAEEVESIPAGNIVAITGLRGAVAGATVSSLDEIIPFKGLHFAVEPVVTVSVEPKNPRELPKLVEGMQLLELVDPSLKAKINEETGEYLLSGTGELHLEIAVKDLQDMQRIEVKQSDPIVTFRESVDGLTPEPVLAKSPNKHNRLWMIAEPLQKEVVEAIESGEIHPYQEPKERAAILRNYGWNKDEARKVWGFGPGERGENMIIDKTKGIQYLREVQDYIVQGFRWGAGEGPLAGEPFYGIRFALTDVTLHEDPVHRGVGQIMPVARRACFGAMMTAKPILLEPIYKIQVNVPERYLGAIYKVLSKRRGKILDTIEKPGTPISIVVGEVPVSESIGINTELRSETSGYAFSQMIFSHWEKVPGDPLKPEAQGGGLARKFVEETRKRKGMHSIVPPDPNEYIDRL
ncbi:MAG: GTP-binding protein [Calditrichaeota bacterium]|nr:MAG: GTP-binding protein [Calditrichota bacterium]